jgi:hypothetical protein
MTSEEQEPTKYKVMFEGCQHNCIMTAQELLNPSRQVYDGSSATYKSDFTYAFPAYEKRKELAR